jgi:hypothetical protein
MKRSLQLAFIALVLACRTTAGPGEPHIVGGNCGEVRFEGHCQLTAARVGPHPNAPSLAIVDTNWQPDDAGAGRQYFTCGPAFAVPSEQAEGLRRHLRANGERVCKGTFATGSCNPCPGAALHVDVPPFDGGIMTPIDEDLVRF